jgi:HAMP domain-containing protein
MQMTIDVGIAVTVLLAILALAVAWGVLKEKVSKLEETTKEMERRFSTEKEEAINAHIKDIEEIGKRMCDDKAHNDKRIQELYESRNDQRTEVAVLAASMAHVVESVGKLEASITQFMAEMRSAR